ncbi:MAG: DUF2384 domain-containing protein [Gallionella sp.]|nr:DUF2384 domain-containing protein [Gallionella sp.]MDP1941004.1 DUF2384 domain-containing protein [Gallionella sp.]
MSNDKQEFSIKSKDSVETKTAHKAAVDKFGIKQRKSRKTSLSLRNKTVSKNSARKIITSRAGSLNSAVRNEKGVLSVVAGGGREESSKNRIKRFGNDRTPWLGSERTTFSRLINFNGLPTDMELVQLVHNRLQITVIDRLIAAGVTKQEIGLIAPPRTLAHRRANDERLTVEESDRAVRMARVVAQTDSVFGSQEKAMSWLRHPHRRFDGRTPIEMLTTDVGSRLVEEALVQIDEGFFA